MEQTTATVALQHPLQQALEPEQVAAPVVLPLHVAPVVLAQATASAATVAVAVAVVSDLRLAPG